MQLHVASLYLCSVAWQHYKIKNIVGGAGELRLASAPGRFFRFYRFGLGSSKIEECTRSETKMVCAWLYDGVVGDQRLPHRSEGKEIALERLSELGVLYWKVGYRSV